MLFNLLMNKCSLKWLFFAVKKITTKDRNYSSPVGFLNNILCVLFNLLMNKCSLIWLLFAINTFTRNNRNYYSHSIYWCRNVPWNDYVFVKIQSRKTIETVLLVLAFETISCVCCSIHWKTSVSLFFGVTTIWETFETLLLLLAF